MFHHIDGMKNGSHGAEDSGKCELPFTVFLQLFTHNIEKWVLFFKI